MKKNLSMEEIEARFAEINALEAEEPTAEEAAAIAAAREEDESETISLEEYKETRDFSGKLMLRIPKELHKALAEAAKQNGVSLNQYALYKLAK